MSKRLVYCLNSVLTTTQYLKQVVHSSKNQHLFGGEESEVLQKLLQ